MPRHLRSPRQSRVPTAVLHAALALGESGSRLEDQYWEAELGAALSRSLRQGQDALIEDLLDQLQQRHAVAYEAVLELLETLSESGHDENRQWLLWHAPMAAWTRYRLPGGPLREATAQALLDALATEVFAPGVTLRLIPELLTLESMPRGFSQTHAWQQALMRQVGEPALAMASRPDTPREEVPPMLADGRYLVGIAACPTGMPFWRWQMAEGREAGRAAVHERWTATLTRLLGAQFNGCQVEYLLPEAWFTSHRQADRSLRPMAIQSSVAFLESSLGWAPEAIRAVVAACGADAQRADEIRIGFTAKGSSDVVHGAVWPLMGDQAGGDEEIDPAMAVIDLLRHCGLREIRRIPGVLTSEFCEDCNVPLYPDPSGQLVHAELPEDASIDPPAFH